MGFQQTVLHRIQQKSRNLKNCWLMNCQKNYLRNCRSCLPRNCNQLYCQYQLHYHTHRIHNQKIHQKNHLQHFHLHHTEHLLRNYLRSELLPVLLQLLRPLPLPDVLPLLLLQYVLPLYLINVSVFSLQQTTSLCEYTSSVCRSFCVIGNSIRISYYIKNTVYSSYY